MLGWLLLASALCGLLSMQSAPHLMRRFGHRKVLAVLAPIFPFAFLAIPLAFSTPTLILALMLTGALGALLAVMANTHAVDVENAYERAIMSSFHAMYSIGALAGAGLAGLFASHKLSPTLSIGATVAINFLLIIVTISWLLRVAHANPKTVDASIDHFAHHSHKKAWWRGVLLIGFITFAAAMAEGAVVNWSTLFLTDTRGVAAGAAVLGYVAFSACMTIGRFSGDFLTVKFGRVPVVRFGTALGAIGIVVATQSSNFYAAVMGFALVGCGISTLIPVLVSIAGSMRGGESHAAIARVSTLSGVGNLFGPALIGTIASRFNMGYALLIPGIILTVAFLCAPLIHRVLRIGT